MTREIIITAIFCAAVQTGAAQADIGLGVGVDIGHDGVDADVSVGLGSVADADVDATIGDGSVADADVTASVGDGSVADADVQATIGGDALADADIGATVGGDSSTASSPNARTSTSGTTGSAMQQEGEPRLTGQTLLTSDGVAIGTINRVTREMVCTQSVCVQTRTRPVLTAEGLVVNVASRRIAR